MNDSHEIEIDRYIQGDMSEEERKDFEHRLEHDPSFNDAYQATLAAHKLIDEVGRLELQSTLQGIEEKAKTEVPVKRIKPRPLMAVAAILVVILGVSLFFNLSGSMTTAEVYDRYYEPYDPPSVLRDNIDEGSENWNKAVEYYYAGNYEDALQYFEISQNDNVHFTTREFYQGMSYLQLEHPDFVDAAYYFNEVRLENSDYKEQANWYYALAILKNGRKIEAKQVFKEIVKNKTYNHRKAKKILNSKIEN